MDTLFFYSYAFNSDNHADTKNYPDGASVTIMLTEQPNQVDPAPWEGLDLITDTKDEITYGVLRVKLANGKPLLSRSKEFAKLNAKPPKQGAPVKGYWMDKSAPIIDRKTGLETGMFKVRPVKMWERRWVTASSE